MQKMPHSSIVRSLVTLVVSACGPGSGLVGTATSGGNGGGNNTVPPVLAFFVQPNSTPVGQEIEPAVEVVARDSLGRTDSTFTGTITVSLTANATGAGLSGTTSRRPVNGIATFDDLRIDKAGTYTLTASTTGAKPITSTAFPITTLTAP